MTLSTLPADTSIETFASVLVTMAKDSGSRVPGIYYDVQLLADPDTTVEEVVASYAKVTALKVQKAEAEKQVAKDLLANTKLPFFTVKNRDAWQLVLDTCPSEWGVRTLVFAATWANAMESRMVEGERLCDIVDVTGETSKPADYTLSSNQLNTAFSFLMNHWVHSNDLAEWLVLSS